jgi:hypothetical protein
MCELAEGTGEAVVALKSQYEASGSLLGAEKILLLVVGWFLHNIATADFGLAVI